MGLDRVTLDPWYYRVFHLSDVPVRFAAAYRLIVLEFLLVMGHIGQLHNWSVLQLYGVILNVVCIFLLSRVLDYIQMSSFSHSGELYYDSWDRGDSFGLITALMVYHVIYLLLGLLRTVYYRIPILCEFPFIFNEYSQQFSLCCRIREIHEPVGCEKCWLLFEMCYYLIVHVFAIWAIVDAAKLSNLDLASGYCPCDTNASDISGPVSCAIELFTSEGIGCHCLPTEAMTAEGYCVTGVYESCLDLMTQTNVTADGDYVILLPSVNFLF